MSSVLHRLVDIVISDLNSSEASTVTFVTQPPTRQFILGRFMDDMAEFGPAPTPSVNPMVPSHLITNTEHDVQY